MPDENFRRTHEVNTFENFKNSWRLWGLVDKKKSTKNQNESISYTKDRFGVVFHEMQTQKKAVAEGCRPSFKLGSGRMPLLYLMKTHVRKVLGLVFEYAFNLFNFFLSTQGPTVSGKHRNSEHHPLWVWFIRFGPCADLSHHSNSTRAFQVQDRYWVISEFLKRVCLT